MTPESSQKLAVVQSSLALGWTQTRWNWSQTGESRAALTSPASWNNKAKTDSNVSPGETNFQSVSIHVYANNEMWLQVHFTFQLRGPEMEKKKHTIKTVSGKVAHALWLAYEMLFITGKKKKIAQRAVYLCLKQLWVGVPWVSLLRLKRIGHPCIALNQGS